MRSVKIAKDILDVLSDQKRHTIMDIAEQIEVSYNTVQRHLADLSLRYPIKITTGGRDSAGVQLISIDCSFNKFLTYEELSLLIKALDLLPNNKENELLKIKLQNCLESSRKSPHADTPATTSVRSNENG